MGRGFKFWLLEIFLVFLLFLISLNFVSAWSDSGSLVQSVDGCNILNTTNAVYTLTQSINTTGTCLNVSADNITIDCGNWSNQIIYGNVSSSTTYYGIYSNKLNTTIRNCEIRRGTLATTAQNRRGIYFISSSNSKIENVNVSNNRDGIYLSSSSNITLINNTANSNSYCGINLYYSSNNVLTDNTANLNSVCGFSLDYSSNNILTNNTANLNFRGVHLSFSNNNNLTNNTINSNYYGFRLYPSNNNILTSNTLDSNIYYAISIYASYYNDILKNLFSKNSRVFYPESVYNITNNINSNIFRDNLNISSTLSTFSQEGTTGNRIDFNLTMRNFNETTCSFCSYKLDLYPSEPSFMNASSGALITGNFTPTKVGIYSLKFNITDENNNSEIRKYIFLINATGTILINYYFRNAPSTRGQSIPLTYLRITDVGSLLFDAPTSSEHRECSNEVSFSVNNLPKYLFGIYKQIDYSIWYQTILGEHTGVQRYMSYTMDIDYSTSISSINSTDIISKTFNFGVNWASDYFWAWYALTIKLDGFSPYIYSNSTNPSFVNITYTYPSTPAIRKITNEDVDVLSATMESNTSNSSEIVLEGDGTTNMSIEMPNSTLIYDISYDGVLCSSNPNCSINSNSNGIINLTLSLGSEHTINIEPDTTPPLVTIVSPTATTYISSSVSFEVRTNENSTCNYSLDSGATNYTMTTNATDTGFTASRTLSNAAYTSNFYCADIFGNLNNTENISFTVDVPVEETITPSGSSVTYNLSSEQLEEGYSKLLRKTQEVQFTINNKIHTAVINSVDSENKKVEIELEELGEVIELNEGEIKKIDLNGDGYYDLQILVNEVRINGYVDLEFKEIHEEIPAGEKEKQEEPSKIEEKIKSWMWISGGTILLIVIGIVIRKLIIFMNRLSTITKPLFVQEVP